VDCSGAGWIKFVSAIESKRLTHTLLSIKLYLTAGHLHEFSVR